MSSSAHRASVVLAFALSLFFGVSSATAAEFQYLLSGNARTQISNGRTLPISTGFPPNGLILAVTNAQVTQTTTLAQPQIKIKPGMLRNAAVPEVGRGIFLSNALVFSVQTNLGFSFPANAQGTKTFAPGGRTGAATTTFTPPGGFPGVLRYTATGAQFGGPARIAMSGTMKTWLRAGALSPPCSPGPGCVVKQLVASPGPIGPLGGAFSTASNQTSATPQIPGVFFVGANAAGSIYFRSATPGSSPGFANAAMSHGGPWTTGMLTVSISTGGVPAIFTLTGSDARVSGQGNVSLVSGALAMRAIGGATPDRGWLNLTIGPQVINPIVPALSRRNVALLATLLAGSSLWMLRRALVGS